MMETSGGPWDAVVERFRLDEKTQARYCNQLAVLYYISV